jgi:amino acid transporter
VQIYRYRLVSGFAQRQQTKWVVLGIVAAAVGYCMFLVLNLLQGGILASLLGYTAALLLLSFLMVSIVVAVLRYRLYDIDLIINRTLVYSTLTATLVALYFAAIVMLQRIFVLVTGRQSTLAVVASTLLIAALFNPLRRRIQSFIDRSFYRRKYDVRKTLEAFSIKLRNETDLETLKKDLVEVVSETMQPAQVSLWLRSNPPSKGSEGQK